MTGTRIVGGPVDRRRGEACGSGRRKDTPEPPRLEQGDCIEVMARLAESSVDAVVCDPPYGIGWQNEAWDSVAIEDAAARRGRGRLSKNEAFEVWCGMWGEQCARVMKPGAHLVAFGSPRTFHRLACGLEDSGLEIRDTLMWLYSVGTSKSRRYAGGRRTTLKPVLEPIVLARRSLDGTTPETIERHGTGAMNAEDCLLDEGRLPANALASHGPDCTDEACEPDCAVALLDATAGGAEDGSGPLLAPSRFLYCAKPTRAERDAGCEALPEHFLHLLPSVSRGGLVRNPHPTLKPIELMRWLVRLVAPAGGLVLDPFMGSGTTGAAAAAEGRRFLGIELDASYVEVASARIAFWGRDGGAPVPEMGPSWKGGSRRRPLGPRRRR